MSRPYRYRLHGYRMRRRAANALTFRPGPATYLFRLRITVLAAMLIGCVAVIYNNGLSSGASSSSSDMPVDDSADRAARRKTETLIHQMEQGLSPQAQRHIAEMRESHRRELDAMRQTLRRGHQRVRIAAWSIMLLLGGIGLYVPLSAVWESLRLECPSPGVLRVRSWSVWPRRRSFHLGDYDYPSFGVVEMRHGGGRYTRPRSSFVYVLKFPYRGGLRGGRDIEFWLRSIPSRPMRGAPYPAEYQEFVVPLCELTNLRLN